MFSKNSISLCPAAPRGSVLYGVSFSMLFLRVGSHPCLSSASSFFAICYARFPRLQDALQSATAGAVGAAGATCCSGVVGASAILDGIGLLSPPLSEAVAGRGSASLVTTLRS